MTTFTDSTPQGFTLDQTTKAVAALVAHAQRAAAAKPDLLTEYVDGDDTTPLEPLDLVISTKKYSATKKNMKPFVLPLKHSTRPTGERGALSICIFTKDTEKEYEQALVETTSTKEACLEALQAEEKALKSKAAEKKKATKGKKKAAASEDDDVADADDTIRSAQAETGLPSLEELASSIQITRVVSLASLRGEYKPYQARRKLISEHDLFFAQDSVLDALPALLGKSFYKSARNTPQVITLSRRTRAEVEALQKIKLNLLNGKGKPVAATETKEEISLLKTLQQIYACYTGASYVITPGNQLSVRVGSTRLTPEQNAENITAAVATILAQGRAVGPAGWANIRGLHIKTPTGPSLPVYIDEVPYVDAAADVVEDEEQLHAQKRERDAAAKQERKRKLAEPEHIEQLLAEVVDEQDLQEYRDAQARERTERKKNAKKAKLVQAAEEQEENSDDAEDEN
ncbi:hypothetical protein D0Z00_001082 [Geotrichum galactomycetum]|uniref:Uncharacterized protein n=1 Tax=Geotrichum galactomycetum TaxID=27317 RepID=A0ACB6V829_9ASCO|nr:hypothetical protein D0Z00_001082 [Geotrichum candidum]